MAEAARERPSARPTPLEVVDVTDPTDFAPLLTASRLCRGLSRAELAARVGATEDIVSAFERGAALPSNALLLALADELGWDRTEIAPLLDPDEDDPPPTDWATVEDIRALVAAARDRLEDLYRSGRRDDAEIDELRMIQRSAYDRLTAAVMQHYSQSRLLHEVSDEIGFTAFVRDLHVVTGWRVDA